MPIQLREMLSDVADIMRDTIQDLKLYSLNRQSKRLTYLKILYDLDD